MAHTTDAHTAMLYLVGSPFWPCIEWRQQHLWCWAFRAYTNAIDTKDKKKMFDEERWDSQLKVLLIIIIFCMKTSENARIQRDTHSLSLSPIKCVTFQLNDYGAN